ncbi:MAG TPA: hypothetical protein VF342_15245 [Alphaproteobacteria bacterium]
MLKIIESVSDALSMIATYVLLALAALLLLQACWEILDSLWNAATSAGPILESIGLIIIAFAVLELSKFIADELIEKKRELRSAREARRSLTRFITTIIIAFSLEALVMVFKANRGELNDAIYPTALFAAAVFALVGLGTYQWLSNKVEPSGESIDEAEAKPTAHQARRGKP